MELTSLLLMEILKKKFSSKRINIMNLIGLIPPTIHLKFSLTSDGTHNGGEEFKDGVIIDSENFKTSITINSSQELFYYCANHPGMGDSIQIQLPLIDNQFYLSEDTIVGEKIGVTDLTNEFSQYSNQLFKTESGAYIIDSSNLSANDNPVSPVLLVKENTSRGVTTTNFDINYTPNEIVDNKEQYQIFYKNKSNWFQDIFSKDGVFQYTNSLNLSQLLNHEASYNKDINDDSSIGDKITSVLFIDKLTITDFIKQSQVHLLQMLAVYQLVIQLLNL